MRVFGRYVDLRGALIALDKSLYGQVPTQADFGPVQDPAQAFAASVDAAHMCAASAHPSTAGARLTAAGR